MSAGLAALAPHSFEGWVPAGEDRRFGPRQIFDYLDGGAEAYLEYGMKQLWVREYARADGSAGHGPRVTLLLFDMGSGGEAFGVFSLEREGAEAGVGQGSELDEGLLRFWRGRYFVTVSSVGRQVAPQAALVALGRRVAAAIPRAGRAPEVVRALPGQGLDQDAVLFVHSPTWLARRLTLPGDNPLGLGRRTRVALGRYGAARLLIVRYPGADRARAAGAALTAALGPRVAARVCGPLLLAALKGRGPAARAALLARAAAGLGACTKGGRTR